MSLNIQIQQLANSLKKQISDLVPIFGSLRLSDETTFVLQNPYKTLALTTIESIVSDKKEPDTEELFMEDEKRIVQLGDYSGYHFIQKYGSRVASEGQTDVSFFDHWRIQDIKNNSQTTDWLLIKGDLMGIQDFIYGDIPIENPGSGRKLAKKLRGKSFFISVLTDFLAEIFLLELNLPMSHLLFAGGGHFNLLVPYDRKDLVDELSKHLNKTLRDKYNQKINLIVAFVQCDDSIFTHAATQMKAVNNERNALKYQQHKGYLSTIFNEKPSKANETDFEDIGSIVPKSEYLVEIINDGFFPKQVKNRHVKLIDLPKLKDNKIVSLWTARDEAAVELLLKQTQNVESAKVINLNNFNFLEVADTIGKMEFPIDYGFRLVGKTVPYSINDDEIADFEEISKLSIYIERGIKGDSLRKILLDTEGGVYPKLSAVRLDIDDLGYIFSSGFGNQSSLERIAALSRELNLFFSGYINHLAEKFGIYIVYSGGDDAFVVGNWKAMMLFIAELNTEFRKFVNNKDIHFSAGVFMCDAHFPVLRFAKESEELQDIAKNHDKNKDQILVFNNPMHWDAYHSVLSFAENILQCTEGSEKLTRSLLFRVLNLIKKGYHEREIMKNGVVQKVGALNIQQFYRNVSNLHYLFARHGFTSEKIKDIQGIISREIVASILTAAKHGDEKKTMLKNYTVALQYAILTLRES